jgi:hypothetical protein
LAQGSGNIECSLLLVDLMNRLYGSEYVEEYEQDKEEKEVGLKEKTLEDYKEEFGIIKRSGQYKITSYKKEKNVVIVPCRIEDIFIEAVGDEVFSAKRLNYKLSHREFLEKQLEVVYFEEGIKELGYYIFDNCFALKEIHIPESVETIGSLGLISGDCIIYGTKGSEVEKYAIKSHLSFAVNNE